MHDVPDIPLLVTGAGFDATWFTDRAVLALRPPDGDGSLGARDWSLGDAGMLLVDEATGALVHLILELRDAPPLLAPPGVELASAQVADQLEVSMPFGVPTSLRRSAPHDGVQWQEVAFDGFEAARATRIAGADLYVRTDAAGRLAAIGFAAPLREPRPRALTIRPGGPAWNVQVHEWFGEDGSSGHGLHLHAPNIDHGSTDDMRYEPSLDGRTTLVTSGVELSSLDVPLMPGTVTLPVEPPAAVANDGVEVDLHWPVEAPTALLDQSSEPARARVDLGPRVERWVALDDRILLGLHGACTLAAILVTAVDVPPPGAHHPFEDPSAHMSQAELQEHMVGELASQFAAEQAAATAFAAEPPFPAIGLATELGEVERSIRVLDGPFGPDDPPAGVALTWGDEFGRVLPDADRTAPLVTVVHERDLDMVFEGLPPEVHDDDLNWLHAQVMLQRQLAAIDDPDLAPSVEESLAMGGPSWHAEQLAQLARLESPAVLVVDGRPLDATVYRTDGAYVLRAVHDGWRTSIRVAGLDGEVPELATVTDLAPFVAGQRVLHDRQVAQQRAWMAAAAERDPEPAHVAAARHELESTCRQLGRGIGRPGHAAPQAPYATLFTDDIVASWGGSEPFERRYALLAQVANVSTSVVVMSRDASVAQLVAHVHLPQPGGGSFGVATSIGGDWWDLDPAEVRARAGMQLDPDQQGEFQLRFQLLAERQEPTGAWQVATDLLELVEAHVGGLERLLTPARPTSGT